ncbi:MAG: hypothetical protein ACIAXF_01050 [Phycisphaerales bacterium JB063]
MFKFIRRYQKWLLVIFCAMLMFAFLVQPVMSIFFPDPSKRTIGTIFEGQKVTENERQSAIRNLATLRQLGFNGLGLFAQEDSEADTGLAWLLLVRAGEHAGFTASDNEAFTALSMKQSSVQDEDSLNALAAQLNIKQADLLGIVKQYLVAEQYRKLVMGHTYEMREGFSGSPGLNRVRLENEVLNGFADLEPAQREAFQGYIVSMLLNATLGRPRISDTAVRHAVQNNNATLGGTLVVFEAEEATDAPTEAQLQELFDQYKGDFAGQGETYGFGYRQPGRVRIESLRVPFEAVRAIAAGEVSEGDVRRYYDQNVFLYANWQPRDQEPEDEAADEDTAAEDPEAGEGDAAVAAEDEANADAEAGEGGEGETAEPGDADTEADAQAEERIDERVRIDYRLRDEIRQVLIHQKTNEMMADIVRDIQRMLAEDARVLKDDNGFKLIPDDFVPTPLTQIAERIQEDYGVALEVIADDGRWVTLPEFQQTASFVSGMTRLMPSRSIWPRDNRGFQLVEVPLTTVPLSGRLGLMSSFFQQDVQGQSRTFTLGRLIGAARELQPDGQAGSPQQPQVGLALPGATVDAAGSAYVSRLTDAQRDRPAESLAEVREDVERDARLLAGYEALVARKDNLLTIARANSIFDIVAGDNSQTVTPFSRSVPPTLEGVSNSQPLVEAAFELAEQLRGGAGVEGTVSADRLVAVELPRERKLLVFLVDSYKPISRSAYQDMVDPGAGTLNRLALEQANTPDADPAGSVFETLSLEAMIRHTGFEYAEDEGPATEGAGDGSESADDE